MKFSILFFLCSIISCASLFEDKEKVQEKTSEKKTEKSESANKKIVLEDQSNKDEKILLQRIKSRMPILSPHSFDDWQEIAGDKKSDIRSRIHGQIATGSYLEAQRDARKILSVSPNNAEALNSLSVALTMNRQYALSSIYAKKLLNNAKYKSHALNTLGMNKLTQAKHWTDYDEAIKLLRASFQSSETAIAAGLNLGYLYLETGNFFEAKSIFQLTIPRCDDCSLAQIGFAISSLRLGEAAIADKILNEMLQKNIEPFISRYYLAVLQLHAGKNKIKAKQILESITKSNHPGYEDLKQRAELMIYKIDNNEAADDDPYFNKNFGSDAKSEKSLN